MESPVPPTQARSDWSYPPEFEQIVLKLLSKNRDDRYAHAMEVKEALEECLAELRERRDAALDFSPDELADIVGAQEQVESGTDTVRLDDDMVSELLSGLSESESQILSGDNHDRLDPKARKSLTDVEEDTETESPPDTLKEENESVAPPTKSLERRQTKTAPHAETIELPDQVDSTRGASWLLTAILGAITIAAAAFYFLVKK